MARSATLDRWPDLSGIGLKDAGNPDARAALLTVNAQMFAAAPARDREIIETFETLALGFLPRMDHRTLVDIARILAPCEDTPASVLDRLVRHSPETRDIVIGHTVHLPPGLVAKLLGTADGRLRLAVRPALDVRTVDSLLAMHESAVDDALAANPCLAGTGPAVAELVRRAQHRPTLGAILLARGGLSPAEEAALYLCADAERRRLIRERLAPSAGTRPDLATLRLTDHEAAALVAAAEAGDVRHLESLLTYAFGFPASTDWRVLATGRHPLLPLALKALGLAERDAIRILLGLHPALSHRLSCVTGLVRMGREPTRAVALVLVEAVLGVQAGSGAAHR